MKTLTKKTPLDGDVNLEQVARHTRCRGMSGADLASLVREAAVTSIRRAFYGDAIQPGPVFVRMDDFFEAFSKISPSVGKLVHLG